MKLAELLKEYPDANAVWIRDDGSGAGFAATGELVLVDDLEPVAYNVVFVEDHAQGVGVRLDTPGWNGDVPLSIGDGGRFALALRCQHFQFSKKYEKGRGQSTQREAGRKTTPAQWRAST